MRFFRWRTPAPPSPPAEHLQALASVRYTLENAQRYAPNSGTGTYAELNARIEAAIDEAARLQDAARDALFGR